MGERTRSSTIADLWDRPCPALKVDISLPGVIVVSILEKLRLQGRIPQRIKVDNSAEFYGKVMDTRIFEHGVQIEFTRPRKHTDNGRIESCNAKLQDECLNQNMIPSRHDDQRTIETLRQDYTSGDCITHWASCPRKDSRKGYTCTLLGPLTYKWYTQKGSLKAYTSTNGLNGACTMRRYLPE